MLASPNRTIKKQVFLENKMNTVLVQPEVFRENRKHLSVTIHNDILKMMRKLAKQQRWTLSRTSDELLLRGLRSVGYLPEE